MDPEQISLIVLICMTALLLFQKKIFLFFKGVYERSVDRYHILLTACMIIFYGPVYLFFHREFIWIILLLFTLVLYLKIMIFAESIDFGKSLGAVIIGGLSLAMGLLMDIGYFLNEDPLITDILLMIVFSIHCLDLIVRSSHDAKRLWNALGTTKTVKKPPPLKNRTKRIMGAMFGIYFVIFAAFSIDAHYRSGPDWQERDNMVEEWIEKHPEYEVNIRIIENPYGKDLERYDYRIFPIYNEDRNFLCFAVTINLTDDREIHLKIKRLSLWNWGVDEESVAIVKGEK